MRCGPRRSPQAGALARLSTREYAKISPPRRRLALSTWRISRPFSTRVASGTLGLVSELQTRAVTFVAQRRWPALVLGFTIGFGAPAVWGRETNGSEPYAAAAKPSAAMGPPVPDAEVMAANRAFELGRLALARGLFGEACRRFDESRSHFPSPVTLLNLGDCYERGDLEGGLPAALETFERARLEAEQVVPEATRKLVTEEAERRATAIRARLTQLNLTDGRELQAALPEPVGESTAAPAAPRPLQATQAPRSPRFGSLPLWLGGASVALGGAWLYTGLMASAKNSNYTALRERCQLEGCDQVTWKEAGAAQRSAKTYAVVTDYALIPAFGVTLGAAIALWLLNDSAISPGHESAHTTGAAQLDCSPNGCWLSYANRF
jgi:hypothetical protein